MVRDANQSLPPISARKDTLMKFTMKTPQQLWPKLFGYRRCTVTGNLWGMNRGGGRFYAANRSELSVGEKLNRLKAKGILVVEAHDTDILPLVGHSSYPDIPEAEKMALLKHAVAKFKDELAARGMRCGMFTMNLFNADPLFNKGNFSSECLDARALAIARTKVGLSIAQGLGCLYVYWNGTDGIDGRFGADHAFRGEIFYTSIVSILQWHHDTHGPEAVPFAAEAKPEEPKFKMYNGTVGALLAVVWRLRAEHADFAHLFGLNIEIAHSVMGKTDPAMDFGAALAANALFHVHINGQGGDPAYDRDVAPDPFELFDCMYQLHLSNYCGLLGIDVQPLPTDRDDQACSTITRTARRIKWAVGKAETANHELLAQLRSNHDQAGIEDYIDSHLLGIAV